MCCIDILLALVNIAERLDDRHYQPEKRYVHEVLVVENTELARCLGKRKLFVNSIHHDYIDFSFKELIVSAYSDDGIIEAVEVPGVKFAMGLQWHPEYLMDDVSRKIFDRFVGSLDECVSGDSLN